MIVQSIRARLTLWYAVAVSMLLVLMGGITYATLKRVTRSDSDTYLTETADAVARSLQLALVRVPEAFNSDSLSARWAADRALENHRFRDIGVAVFRARHVKKDSLRLFLLAVDTTSSTTRYFGGTAGWQRASTSAVRALASKAVDIVTLEPQRERVVSVPVSTRRGTFVISVSQSLAARDALFKRFREAIWIGFPLALLIVIGGGWLLVAASLQQVEAMRLRAETITASNLHSRLPVSSADDELSRLSLTFNALLDRVEDAFDQRRRFTADASHELRTPVSIVIGESELALSSERTPEQYRAALKIIHGEARRLASIVADLFLLARRDAAEHSISRSQLFLEELTGDCVDAIASVARTHGVDVSFSPVSEVPYAGDEGMLKRLVMNLLDNAIKYTPAGGRILVEVMQENDGTSVVRVTDSGLGIPTEHQSRIFERFYRVQHTTDRSGLPSASGAGLGLPIARWIAEAHGGVLSLARSDSSGSVFELRLPPLT